MVISIGTASEWFGFAFALAREILVTMATPFATARKQARGKHPGGVDGMRRGCRTRPRARATLSRRDCVARSGAPFSLWMTADNRLSQQQPGSRIADE